MHRYYYNMLVCNLCASMLLSQVALLQQCLKDNSDRVAKHAPEKERLLCRMQRQAQERKTWHTPHLATHIMFRACTHTTSPAARMNVCGRSVICNWRNAELVNASQTLVKHRSTLFNTRCTV
jgi:hypothetical protein